MTADSPFIHRYQRGRAPRTVLLLHGTGGNEDDLMPLAAALDPEAGVLSPRGRVLENGAPRFFRRLAEGIFDLEDLRVRTHELADFIAASATTYGFDPAQVTAVGFSNGANVAAAVLLLRPGTLARAVLLRAMVPLEPDIPPALSGTGVFLSAGRTDPIIPPSNTERLAKMLRDYGATVELRWSPGGHSLGQDDVVAARRWMAEST